MAGEEKKLVGEPVGAPGSTPGPRESPTTSRSRDHTTESTRSTSGGTNVRRPSVYRDEAVLPAMLRIIQRKFGQRFQETRDVVTFVGLVALAAVYLVVSSKLILDYLEISGGVDVSNVTVADESSVRYTFPPECITANGIYCLPEAMYMDKHITKATLCSDLFSSVCNDNYFYSAERRDSWLWPYRYSSLYLIYNALQRAVRVDYHNFATPVDAIKENALYKTLYFLKNCTANEDRARVNIGHIKRTLALIGLPSIPYTARNESVLPDIAEVVAKVTRNLNIEIFFVVDVDMENSVRKFILRKLPVNHLAIERQRSNIATEYCEFMYYFLKTRDLMDPHGKLYEYISKDFYDFARNISEERGKMTAIETDQTIDISQLPTGAAPAAPAASGTQKVFNWLLFFKTLFPITGGFTFTDKTNVTVRDHEILANVMKAIHSKPRHIVLNYIMLLAWYVIAPLLPDAYLKTTPRLPNDHYMSIGNEKFLPSCVKLAEKFCPTGMTVALLNVSPFFIPEGLSFIFSYDVNLWPPYESTKVMKFKDFTSASNWGAALVDIYRKYMKIFIEGIDTVIPGPAAKSDYFKTYVVTKYGGRAMHVGILPKYRDPVANMKCNASIRTPSSSTEDDVVLMYFINSLKRTSNEMWDARFSSPTSYDYVEVMRLFAALHHNMTAVTKVHLLKGGVKDFSDAGHNQFGIQGALWEELHLHPAGLCCADYTVPDIQEQLDKWFSISGKPSFRETYVTMSLGDFLKAFFRALFYEEDSSSGQITRGEVVKSYVQVFAQDLWNEFADFAAVNRTTGASPDAEHLWLLGELLVAKYMFRLLFPMFGQIPETISNGLPPEYKRTMKYILFAEAACRNYKEIPLTMETLYYYGLPPRSEVNFALSNYSEFQSAFECNKTP